MTTVGRCHGDQVCTRDLHCAGCRAALASASSYLIPAEPGIPVRRYGKLPLLDDEPAWEIEPLAAAEAPRSVGDYGGTAVFLAAMAAAVLAGCVLYLH